jgi:hypothetical protein
MNAAIPFSLLVLVALVAGPCDESLPSHEEPDAYFQGRITAQYSHSPNENGLRGLIVVRNVFDETLQGSAALQGSVIIESLRNPALRKTVQLTRANILFLRGYDARTNTFTFDAGDSISMVYTWDFASDDGARDWRTSFFTYVSDTLCNGLLINRCLALTEDLMITVQFTVFHGRVPMRAMTQFPLCYVSRYVHPNFCPTPMTNPPCFIPPSPAGTPCIPTGFEPILTPR